MKTRLLCGVAAVLLVALLVVAGCSNPLTGGASTNGWAATAAVTHGGNLAASANGPVGIALLAGQHQVAGSVHVTNDSENLYIEFVPDDAWCIVETHVHVAHTLDGFPLVGRWRTPAPGQFDFKTDHSCEPPYEYTIALGDFDVQQDLIIAAHAKLSDGAVTETAWADGTRFAAQGNWATYFTYRWTFMLNLEAAPEGTGSVAGQGRYPAGAPVTLSATPEDDWRFVNWTDEDGEQISDQWEFTYTMPPADCTLTANFEELEPEEVDLTGYWDAYLLMNGDREGPFLFYFVQTGNSFKSYDGTGTIDGSTLTMFFDDGEVESSGTIQSADFITGAMNFYGMPMLFEFNRVDAELAFGSFSLSGDFELNTQEGLGGASEEEVFYVLDFDIRTSVLEGFLWFKNTGGLEAGTYEVVRWFLDQAGPGEVNASFCDTRDDQNNDEDNDNDFDAQSGELVIFSYSPDAVSGEFTLYFEDGNWFSGSFDLRQPPFGPDSQVTVTGGHWFGADLEPETCDGVNWSAGEEIEPGGFGVYFMDENGGIWLELYPATEMGTGTFNVPADMEIGLYKLTDYGDEIESVATSGQLVITRYEEGIGMAGFFDDMLFKDEDDGAMYVVSGAFDVSFEITGQRWTINF